MFFHDYMNKLVIIAIFWIFFMISGIATVSTAGNQCQSSTGKRSYDIHKIKSVCAPYLKSHSCAPYVSTSGRAPFKKTCGESPYLFKKGAAPYLKSCKTAPYIKQPGCAPYRLTPGEAPASLVECVLPIGRPSGCK